MVGYDLDDLNRDWDNEDDESIFDEGAPSDNEVSSETAADSFNATDQRGTLEYFEYLEALDRIDAS